MGKHRGILGTLVSYNDAGCKLEIRGRNQNQSHLGDKRFGSIQWPMLMNLYEPEGTLQDVIITVDKNDFVVSVRKEGEVLKPEDFIDTSLTAKPGEAVFDIIEGIDEQEVAPVETRICKGPWHRGKGGQGTAVPVTEFGIVKIGPYTGKVAKTCNSCLQKNHEYDAKRGRTPLKVTTVETVSAAIPVTLNGEVTPPAAASLWSPAPAGKFRWKVTIVKEVTMEIEADDFLDAGSKAGDGEIVKVERIK